MLLFPTTFFSWQGNEGTEKLGNVLKVVHLVSEDQEFELRQSDLGICSINYGTSYTASLFSSGIMKVKHKTKHKKHTCACAHTHTLSLHKT